MSWFLNRLVALDNRLSDCLTLSKQTGWQRRVAVVGAHLGDGLLWLVIGVIVFGLGKEAARHFVLRAAVPVIIAGGLTAVLKFLMRRGRPREMTGFYSTRYDRYSFPSGHATRAACLALVFSYQFPCWA
ncbi:MAG: phosphatase PAP2 family protein, partial [Anaerolineales bacterium]|nr:phosphatase PAP2 family protein [Anaerolineales bacterium]